MPREIRHEAASEKLADPGPVEADPTESIPAPEIAANPLCAGVCADRFVRASNGGLLTQVVVVPRP